MSERTHCVVVDSTACTGCVGCMKVCPTRAIRVRGGLAEVNRDKCIDCGACIDACGRHAVGVRTSRTSDLKTFKYTVALPSLTLYTQFGRDAMPGRVQRALRSIGFDACYDLSWMCAMVGGATDAYLSEHHGPWPVISVTCPAVVRLIQIRYPDLIPHLLRIETPRELAAKLCRRRLVARVGLAPEDIGIFFISPCSAIIHSITAPVGLGASYLDGAFSISELYGALLRAIKTDHGKDEDANVTLAGLGWARADGETSAMRNVNTMTVSGLRDVLRVFDRLESGVFRDVDFIEASICADGCLSGQLTVEGRYAARRSLRQIARRLRDESTVSDDEVRRLMREHFFDVEQEVGARVVEPVRDLRQAVISRRERVALRARLAGKNCGACGTPDCDGLAEDIQHGEADLTDCPFVRLAQYEADARAAVAHGTNGANGAKATNGGDHPHAPSGNSDEPPSGVAPSRSGAAPSGASPRTAEKGSSP
jgi:iron only hydrogenase large subunit-like protein